VHHTLKYKFVHVHRGSHIRFQNSVRVYVYETVCDLTYPLAYVRIRVNICNGYISVYTILRTCLAHIPLPIEPPFESPAHSASFSVRPQGVTRGLVHSCTCAFADQHVCLSYVAAVTCHMQPITVYSPLVVEELAILYDTMYFYTTLTLNGVVCVYISLQVFRHCL
jgi:hypothetical protein